MQVRTASAANCTPGSYRFMAPTWRRSPVRSASGRQFLGFGQRSGERFLDQDVLARLQGARGQRQVQPVRDGDDNRLDRSVGHQVVGACVPGDVVALRDSLGQHGEGSARPTRTAPSARARAGRCAAWAMRPAPMTPIFTLDK